MRLKKNTRALLRKYSHDLSSPNESAMRNIRPVSHVVSPATLQIERRGTGLRIVAGGEWVTEEAARLEKELESINRGGANEFEIDGQGVVALDSAGVWLLLRLARTLERSGARRSRFVVPLRYSPLVAALERQTALGSVQPVAYRPSF